MDQMNRRDFVKAAVAAAAACACISCPLSSEALAGPGAGGTIDVGTLTDYPTDGTISNKFLSRRIAVIRNGGKIYATTAICTHKQSVLKINGNEFVCPKHGSHFSIDGTATHGPAKNSLVRFEITKNDAGHLIVNTAKSFPEKSWSDPASFVSVT